MKRLFKLLSWIGMVFWASLALLALAYIAFSRGSPDGPELFGIRFLAVLSDSMNPAVHTGDLIIASRPDPGRVKPGDIITYRDNTQTRLITHRVIRIEGESDAPLFLTRGDANNVDDGRPVYARDLVGLYQMRIPYGGYLAQWAKSWMGFLFLVIIPGVAVIAAEVRALLHLGRAEAGENAGMADS